MNDPFGLETTIPEASTRPIGEIIEEYANMRDMLKEKRRDFKDFESKVKLDMEMLEADILDKQRQLGLTSLSTESYTAFQTTKEFFRVGNWDTIIEYIKKSGNYQMLEKRIGKLATKEIIETEGISADSIGVEYTAEVHVQIRKK